MRPVLFEVFDRQIGTYGLLIVAGAGAAWLLIKLLSRTGGKENKDALHVFLICICGGFVGAFLLRPIMRIPDIIMNWQAFSQLPLNVMVASVFGEIVFYGGLIGGVIAMIIFCRGFKIPIIPVADIFAPALALAHGFGRIGCFLGGCCYGIATSPYHPFAVTFPADSLIAPPGTAVIATQLIEAVSLFILAAVLIVIYKLVYRREIPKYSGIVVCFYGLLYSTLRFILEFYRGDAARGIYGAFSTSQYISISVFAVSAALMCYIIMRNKKPQN